MKAEEIRAEVKRLQDVAGNIKTDVGDLRMDITKLEGAIKEDIESSDAKLKETEQRAYQRGYEEGFAEGRTRRILSKEKDKSVCIGDVIILKDSNKEHTGRYSVLDIEHFDDYDELWLGGKTDTGTYIIKNIFVSKEIL